MAEAGPQPEAPPPELWRLVEPLAAELHAEWMVKKRDQGWKLGPLDPDARTHPDLIPYEDLPDDSKELDRASAIVVIRGIYRFGWRIVHQSEPDGRP
jgi:adenylate cyclase